MSLNLLPLTSLGAVESNRLWLPWVSAGDGNALTVKIIHEADQFLEGILAREFSLTHSVRPPYGDFWSATVPIAGTAPSAPESAWGTPGRYVYRYTIVNPNVGALDWIIDPFAREFGVGKLSAFTLGYQPYEWSAAEAQWRVPPLSDLILYEINVAELEGDLERTRNVMAYLSEEQDWRLHCQIPHTETSSYLRNLAVPRGF
jgi:maltooligosyltrehalose trehalohydrolase